MLLLSGPYVLTSNCIQHPQTDQVVTSYNANTPTATPLTKQLLVNMLICYMTQQLVPLDQHML